MARHRLMQRPRSRTCQLAEQIEIVLEAGHLPDPDVQRAMFIRDSESIHGVAERFRADHRTGHPRRPIP